MAVEAFLEVPTVGDCIPGGQGERKLTYETSRHRELELVQFQLKGGRSTYTYDGHHNIPIYASCICCNEVYHASAFGVKEGSIEVRERDEWSSGGACVRFVHT